MKSGIRGQGYLTPFSCLVKDKGEPRMDNDMLPLAMNGKHVVVSML